LAKSPADRIRQCPLCRAAETGADLQLVITELGEQIRRHRQERHAGFETVESVHPSDSTGPE
jgi:hypothetical protein